MSHAKSLCKEPSECLLRLPSLRLFIQRDVATLRAAGRGAGVQDPCPIPCLSWAVVAEEVWRHPLRRCHVSSSAFWTWIFSTGGFYFWKLILFLPVCCRGKACILNRIQESLITHLPRKHVERRKSLLCLFVQMWTRGTVRKVNPSSLVMRTGQSQPQTSPTRGRRCPAQMLLSGGCPQCSQQPQSWAGSAWGINVTQFSQSQARISYWDEEFNFGSLSCRLML